MTFFFAGKELGGKINHCCNQKTGYEEANECVGVNVLLVSIYSNMKKKKNEKKRRRIGLIF